MRRNPDTSSFDHMQARLHVLSSKPEAALKLFRAKLETRETPHQVADQYGYALALFTNKQYEEARRETARLLKARANYVPYHILLAEIELATGHKPAGLKIYADAARLFSNSLALIQRHAAALIQSGQPAQAQQLLDKAVRQRPQEPALYKLLASAAGESGKRMDAHRAYGEYYYLTGQPRAAIEQFELAIRFASNNFYYVSSLEARIKDVRETLPPSPAAKKPEREPQFPPDRK